VKVLVIGGGSAAEELCQALADEAGSERVPYSVTVVERSLVGGECPFVACMPSKALLRSASVRRLVERAGLLGGTPADPATGRGTEALARATSRRDLVAEGRDDREHAEDLEGAGVELLRGTGRITGPGEAEVTLEDGTIRRISWEHLVIATGSEPSMPPIEGLDEVEAWTSDDALARPEQPATIAVLGGGPVGCELAEIYSAYLDEVILLETADRLVARESSLMSERMANNLRRHGVDVRLGTELKAVGRDEGGVRLHLSDGSEPSVERLVVATGRRPAVGDLGLDALGIEPDEGSGSIRVDSHCAVEGATNVFAIGDVNGLAPFTHAAKHQARLVARSILGGRSDGNTFDSRLIPRCVFTDPPLAAVGLGPEDAVGDEHAIDVATACIDLAETARAQADGRLLAGAEDGRNDDADSNDALDASAAGVVQLVANRSRRVLIGASAFGPHADEWISELTLAIQAEIPLGTLANLVHPFPTYGEALEPAIRDLLRQCDEVPSKDRARG
jgi:pyruvate/2-oxoglutarate dehydrogenase complex dihydrolipoamide dehydrogenase (E3) component